MRKEITYPQFVFGGIRPNHRAIPLEKNLRIFGADSETFKGEPITIQAHDGTDTLFEYVTGPTVFKTFIPWLFDRSRDRGVNICYFHFLRFDMPVVFYEKRLAMYEQISEIKFDHHGYECELLFGKINKATIKRKGRTVHLFDSWSFTQASLERSLSMMKIDAKKLKKPERLGKVDYRKLAQDDPERLEFEEYARVDASSEYKLGRAIMSYHEKYKVRPSISLPQFAARVFRHHFFKADETIPFPPVGVLHAAELSYHGGKNGKYPEDEPFIVEDAYEVDISSAYPFAMKQMPQMIKGDYVRVRDYEPGLAAIYKVSGEDLGKYPLVFDHDFKPVRGAFEDIWITSYEMDRIVKATDVRYKVSDGWAWIPDPSHKHNPLAEYVDHFYELKERTHKDDPNYYFYKIMLNGLYGKFVQTTEIRRLEKLEEKEDGKTASQKRDRVPTDYEWDAVLQKFIRVTRTHRAGGLYNPFIATLITGFVRGYLYDLETRHEGFHSATDAIKTTHFVPKKKGLGGLKIETFGRCYTFRNKLYLHFAKDSTYCGHDKDRKNEDGRYVDRWRWEDYYKEEGQHLCKFGLHGFKGGVKELFEARHALLRGESFEYQYNHMVGLREGFRRREDICSMVKRRESVQLKKGKIARAELSCLTESAM